MIENNLFKPDSNGLFVFSDPGAAKGVLAQALKMKNNLEKLYILSDRNYSFYKDFGFDVIVLDKLENYHIDNLELDFIFTGTSYTSKLELNFIKYAKKKGIKTFSFVDHWTSIKNRFKYNDYYIFPDYILLIDQRAKEIAIQEGLLEKDIVIWGNPYYEYLKNWIPSISKNQIFKNLGLKENKKLVVFAPDPISNINGKGIYGFDEFDAINELNKILVSNNFDFNLVLKLHPNQNKEILNYIYNKNIVIANSEIDSNLLIYYSDIVIGFFSNFLIEANIMNKKIIRYHLKSLDNDPLYELNIGKIYNSLELEREFKYNI
jgi:hypothetical protein